MTKDEFVEVIEDFADRYVSEYALGDVTHEIITFDPEEPEHAMAVIRCEFVGPFPEITWEIPIGIDLDGEVAIAASSGNEVYLDLDAGGLYSFLFFKALDKLKEKTKRKSK